MASPTAPILQIASFLLGAFGLIGALFRGYIEHPAAEYETKVRELQEDHWRSVSTELGELFVEVEESFTPSEVEGENVPLSARYGMFINKQFSRGVLNDLESELANMDEPRQVFEKCRRAYNDMLPMFIGTLLLAVPAVILVVVLPILPSFVFSAALFGFGTATFVRGFWKGYQYWQSRKELDERWEEYHLY